MKQKKEKNGLKLLGQLMIASWLALGAGCQDLGEFGFFDTEGGEDTASEAMDSDTVSIQDSETAYPYEGTDSEFDCEGYYVCLDRCDMTPFFVDADTDVDGDSDIVVDTDTGWMPDCWTECEMSWPQCVTPQPVNECEEQFDVCVSECKDVDTGWECSVTDDGDSEDCMILDVDTEGCFEKCEYELENCWNPPVEKCEEQLDECLWSCNFYPDCGIVYNGGDIDSESLDCISSDSDGFYNYGCDDRCFMQYDQCVNPGPVPVDRCEQTYDYCVDECAWDDKFCHDHCYESFYYCMEDASGGEDYTWCDEYCQDTENGNCIKQCCTVYADGSEKCWEDIIDPACTWGVDENGNYWESCQDTDSEMIVDGD
ncbi:MAG: hypothetical protein JXR76_09795 [Deltaproteobacteria bacterium]|nr:hypothetical protein [Deltaproteobacteria bacterium]